MHADLQPPLSLIRAALGQPNGDAASELFVLPAIELARRREAVARRAFPDRWAPGRLVSVVHGGRLFGVLLDECVGGGHWTGWMAASEADWASAFDVLLEAGDEPFEPRFGVIQAWNALTIQHTPELRARVIGELSATRLAAIRAVHEEWQAGRALAIDAAPGRIASRTVCEVFTVLSGTPLGLVDPRADYQRLYRDAATRLQSSTAAEPDDADRVALPLDTGWSRLRRWFAADSIVRPVLALLVLVLILENAVLLSGPSPSRTDDDVQARSMPEAPSTPAATAATAAVAEPELTLRWKPGVDLDAAQALLRDAGAEVVGGPDAQGAWRLHLDDVVEGRITLAASPLVDSMAPGRSDARPIF